MRIGGEPDHGGGIDAAARHYGGQRSDWLDLSTGINPVPFPIPPLSAAAWSGLPDQSAFAALETAARAFWRVPAAAALLAAPGASALIARIPHLQAAGSVAIPGPTYNEHARAFLAAGWHLQETATARVIVHPNNPDGRLHASPEAAFCVIDESFCDTHPDHSHIALSTRPGTLILKSFGKFWGLAGLRLGFAIGDPGLVAALGAAMGPWPVSGPALAIGATALADFAWAAQTRSRLIADAARLDDLMQSCGAVLQGGTPLFRLYDVADAAVWQDRLARHQIWSRVFPYSERWLRLGLPGTAQDWARLERAVG